MAPYNASVEFQGAEHHGRAAKMAETVLTFAVIMAVFISVIVFLCCFKIFTLQKEKAATRAKIRAKWKIRKNSTVVPVISINGRPIPVPGLQNITAWAAWCHGAVAAWHASHLSHATPSNSSSNTIISQQPPPQLPPATIVQPISLQQQPQPLLPPITTVIEKY